VLTFALIMVAAAVTVYSIPAQYYSKVSVEVKQQDLTYSKKLHKLVPDYDPQFTATQLQFIQSREILDPVIDRLQLVKEYASRGQAPTREQVFFRLKQALQVRQQPRGILIEIGVYDTNQDRAANIANTIAVVYQERRRADQQKNLALALRRMHEDIGEQREALEAVSRELADLRQQARIYDPNPDNPDVTPPMPISFGE
jgi:uncharacterized protein involved in exopolysaccharide biosynthesis